MGFVGVEFLVILLVECCGWLVKLVLSCEEELMVMLL